MGYFSDISSAVKTSRAGLKLTLDHLLQVRKKRNQEVTQETFFDADEGTATLQFPHESIPVPDNGRYKLHNEIDDCIVCDKCAKVCPVNCIEIVPIRSPEVFGETSDGTAKRIYAEKFDIDMSKCMFCGLCTTVCPTECLTMTHDYDYSTFDIRDHLFPFGEMTDMEIREKKENWESHQAQKAAKSSALDKKKGEATVAKSAFKVKAKPALGKPAIGKPAVKKPVIGKSTDDKPADAKPVVNKPAAGKPVIKKPVPGKPADDKPADSKPKSPFKPRPIIPKKPRSND